jgi:hypothetical protein
MSKDSARQALEEALEALQKDGSTIGVESTAHGVSPSEFFEIADAVRTEGGANVHIGWRDGMYVYGAGRGTKPVSGP